MFHLFVATMDDWDVAPNGQRCVCIKKFYTEARSVARGATTLQ